MPFPTTGFHILSEKNTPLPLFALGELALSGHQLAKEYFKNPTLTAERFLETEKGRLYKTGDVVRMLPGSDGVEFVGRTDDQVKIRGLRVELDEINVVLKNAESKVQDVVTMVLKHERHEREQLVAFLGVGKCVETGAEAAVVEDKDGLTEVVLEAAKRKLAYYMVPGIVLLLDHIPLSAAGKANKKALKELFQILDLNESSESSSDAASTETWSSAEDVVRKILSELSKTPIEKIKKDTTIYHLGFDSISANQIVPRLKKEGLKIGILDLLMRPSVEALGDILPKDEKEEIVVSDEDGSQNLDKVRVDLTASPEHPTDDEASRAVTPVEPEVEFEKELEAMEAASRKSVESLKKVQDDVPDGAVTPIEIPPEEKEEEILFLTEFDKKHRATILEPFPKDAFQGIAKVLPCTSSQEGMISQFMHSNGKLYFNHWAYVIPKNTNLNKLKNAWQAVMDYQTILRTGFVVTSEKHHPFAMVVYRRGVQSLKWAVHDLHTDENVEWKRKDLEEESAKAAFENLALPPWRVNIIRKSTGRPETSETILMFSGLHALYDGHSLALLRQDVSALYKSLAPTSIPYFGPLLAEICTSTALPANLEESKKFWTEKLKDVAVNKFPTLTPNKEPDTGCHVKTYEGTWKWTDVERGARKMGVSVPVLAMAAWARVLGAYLGEAEVVFGNGKLQSLPRWRYLLILL